MNRRLAITASRARERSAFACASRFRNTNARSAQFLCCEPLLQQRRIRQTYRRALASAIVIHSTRVKAIAVFKLWACASAQTSSAHAPLSLTLCLWDRRLFQVIAYIGRALNLCFRIITRYRRSWELLPPHYVSTTPNTIRLEVLCRAPWPRYKPATRAKQWALVPSHDLKTPKQATSMRVTVSLCLSTHVRVGFLSKTFRFWRDWERRKRFNRDPAHKLLVLRCVKRAWAYATSWRAYPCIALPWPRLRRVACTFATCSDEGVQEFALTLSPFSKEFHSGFEPPCRLLAHGWLGFVWKEPAAAKAVSIENRQGAKQERQRLRTSARLKARSARSVFSRRMFLRFFIFSPRFRILWLWPWRRS